jgi:glucosamine--fructose-6-phosphate aminotransferase (isomerizing)
LDQAIECRTYEVSVATTSTLNAVLTACTAGLLMSAGKSLDVADLHSLPGMAAPLVARLDKEARVLASLGCKQVVVLGTGPLYGLAKAAALSIFEMSLIPTAGYHTIVYPHGHKVNIDRDTLVVFFLSDSGIQEELAVLEEVQAMGARTAVIGEGVSKIKSSFISELGSGVKETVRLPLYMIFAQLLGYHLALLVGQNPDAPPNLRKVF